MSAAQPDFWKAFGFSENPYNSRALSVDEQDADLFVGRDKLAVDFQTLIESADGCTVILSGDIGVGKTSFFNVMQYESFAEQAAFGPILLPAFELTPLSGDDDATSLARRIVHNAVKSVERVCTVRKREIPKQIKDIERWLSHRGKSKAFNISLSIMGTGGGLARDFSVPPVSEATLENWRDILAVVSSEACHLLGFQGIFVAIDNVENFEDDRLLSILMSYRDTIFLTPKVWFIVIGQKGLYSLIDAKDKRITQRIQGGGIEVGPLSADELHDVIERRVQKFRRKDDAVSPLPREIHALLYEVSKGEIRFVLNTSETLVRHIISEMRSEAVEGLMDKAGLKRSEKTRAIQDLFEDILGSALVDKQIPIARAKSALKRETATYMADLGLKKKELDVLHLIGDGEARASDFRDYKLRSMQDFSSNYLSRMFKLGLLNRRQAGSSVYYSLRGYSALASYFKLYGDLVQGAK